MTHRPIMLDVAGLRLDADDRRRLSHPAVGGVILFARNFVSREQLVELVGEIRAVRADVLICVDHEGGRVQRFRTDGFTVLPSMARLGALAGGADAGALMQASRLAHATGYVLAAELRACDIDFSFTPVLDLDHGRSQVIGDRAFSRDPVLVTHLARALIAGLAQAGMANCGKHFPGHGFAEADSHIAVPTDERREQDLLALDAAPYAWLAGPLLAVMPAHVIYPQVDSLPAGFSRTWIEGILRKRLGFDGAVLSDDLSMAGAHVAGSIDTRAEAALKAGCDMVLVCNSPSDADALLRALRFVPNATSAERLARLRGRAPWGGSLQHDRLYRACRAALDEL